VAGGDNDCRLTEAQAAERHPGARFVELPLTAVDRSCTAQRTNGFIKIVVGPQAAHSQRRRRPTLWA
jgi:pyruvate/2-oxoglutarate dehydrogenase complex dihydrolipoamide dehydrogenase (E3) component